MNHDAMVNEVRKARAELLAEHGGDVRQLLRECRKHQWTSGHPVVSFPGKAREAEVGSGVKVAEAKADYQAKGK